MRVELDPAAVIVTLRGVERVAIERGVVDVADRCPAGERENR
jgi:hypothetical protein